MVQKKGNKKVGRPSQAITEETKQDIINSAAKIFADRGFEGASLRMISENAKTTHGMIRHYFGTKEDLWKAAVDYLVDQLEIRQIPILDQMEDIDPVQLYKSYIRNIIYRSSEYPEFAKIIVNEGSKKGRRLNYILKRSIPFHRAVGPVFHSVQKKGLLTRYSHDEFYLFLITTAMLPISISPLTDKILGGNILSKDGIRQHADLVIATFFNA